jgi:hypothetical protein
MPFDLHKTFVKHMMMSSSWSCKADVPATEMKVKLVYISIIDVTIPYEREAELMTPAIEMWFWEHIVQF